MYISLVLVLVLHTLVGIWNVKNVDQKGDYNNDKVKNVKNILLVLDGIVKDEVF